MKQIFESENEESKKLAMDWIYQIIGKHATPSNVDEMIDRIFFLKDAILKDKNDLPVITNGRPEFRELTQEDINNVVNTRVRTMLQSMYDDKDYENPTTLDSKVIGEYMKGFTSGTKEDKLEIFNKLSIGDIPYDERSDKTKEELREIQRKKDVESARKTSATNELKDAIFKANQAFDIKITPQQKTNRLKKALVTNFELQNGVLVGYKDGKSFKSFPKKKKEKLDKKFEEIKKMDSDLVKKYTKNIEAKKYTDLTKPDDVLKEHFRIRANSYKDIENIAREHIVNKEKRPLVEERYLDSLERSKVFDTQIVLPDGQTWSFVDKDGNFVSRFKEILTELDVSEQNVKYLEEFTKNALWNSGAAKEAVQYLREDNAKIMRQLTGKSTKDLSKVGGTLSKGFITLESIQDFTARYNEAVDNRSRYAMYADSRKKGYSMYDSKKRVLQNLFNWNQVQHRNIQKIAPFIFSTTMMTQLFPMYFRQLMNNPEKFVRLMNTVQLVQASQSISPSEMAGIQEEDKGYQQYTSQAQYAFGLQSDSGTIYAFKSHTPLEFLNAMDQLAKGNWKPMTSIALSGLAPGISELLTLFGFDPYTKEYYEFGSGERIKNILPPQVANAMMTAGMVLSAGQHLVSYLSLTPEQRETMGFPGLWTDEEIQKYANHFAKRFAYVINPADQTQSYANMMNYNIEALAKEMGMDIDIINDHIEKGKEILKDPELTKGEKEVAFSEVSQSLFKETLPYWTAQTITKVMGGDVSSKSKAEMARYNLAVKSAQAIKQPTIREAQNFITENK